MKLPENLGKTIAVSFLSLVGAVAAVAQIAEYRQSQKFDYIVFAVYAVAGVMLAVFSPQLIKRLWRRRKQAGATRPPRDLVTVATTASLVVIAAATVVIAVTGLWALIAASRSTQTAAPPDSGISVRDSPATTPSDLSVTPTQVLNNPQAAFKKPVPDLTIDWGSNVDVEGTVTYLGANSLWLVTKPEAGDGKYYLTENSFVTNRDGSWFYTDSEVGDSTDKGKRITYLAIEANAVCADTLSKAGDTIDALPSGCTQLASVSIRVN